jgi:hypothetical protein
MIKELHNTDIDRIVWDSFIDQSPQGNIYAQSWYLDIVAPDWKAYFFYKNKKLIAIFPFLESKKVLFSYIIQPIHSQQLGVFTASECEDYKEMLGEVLSGWKHRQWLISYNFNLLNSKVLETFHDQYNFSSNLTHHLCLASDYQILYKNYSTNHKRNLKKALKAEIIVEQEFDIESLIDLFRKNKGQELGTVTEKEYQSIKNLFDCAIKLQCVNLLIARDKQGEMLAGCMYLLYKDSIVYLFGGISPKGKKLGASVLVQDALIKTYAGSNRFLDFEGSNNPSLARFYKGFGAIEKQYQSLNYNKSRLIVVLKNIYKYVRSR